MNRYKRLELSLDENAELSDGKFISRSSSNDGEHILNRFIKLLINLFLASLASLEHLPNADTKQFLNVVIVLLF